FHRNRRREVVGCEPLLVSKLPIVRRKPSQDCTPSVGTGSHGPRRVARKITASWLRKDGTRRRALPASSGVKNLVLTICVHDGLPLMSGIEAGRKIPYSHSAP